MVAMKHTLLINLYNTIKLLFMVKKSKKLHKNSRALISCTEFKGNAQFVQKVTFESLINFKQDH